MKKNLFKALTGVVLGASLFLLGQFNVSAQSFKDVPKTHPAYNEIESIHSKGIISGYTNGNFGPNDSLTRAQVSKILGESLSLKDKTAKTLPYKDVTTGAYYINYLNPLMNAGAFVSATKFNPNDKLTNAQLVKILSVSYGVTETNYSVVLPTNLKTHWAKDHYNALIYAGILTPAEANVLKPNDPAKRSTVAVYTDRLMKQAKSQVSTTVLKDTKVQYFSVDNTEIYSLIKSVGTANALDGYASIVAADLNGYNEYDKLNFIYNHLFVEGDKIVKNLGLSEKTGYATVANALLKKSGLSSVEIAGTTHSWNNVTLSNKDVVIVDIRLDRMLNKPYITLGVTSKIHNSYANTTNVLTGVSKSKEITLVKTSTIKTFSKFE